MRGQVREELMKHESFKKVAKVWHFRDGSVVFSFVGVQINFFRGGFMMAVTDRQDTGREMGMCENVTETERQ